MDNYPPGVTDKDFDTEFVGFEELQRVLAHAHTDVLEAFDEDQALKLDKNERKILTNAIFSALDALDKAYKVCNRIQSMMEAEEEDHDRD